VQEELLARGFVDPRQEDEDEEEFSLRLQEEVDCYINCHNIAYGYCI